jgi:hypothetical protein
MRGHIRERSPGRWAIVLDVCDPQTGARKRRWHSFKGTKREAQVECARLISEVQQGGAVDPSRITIAEFLDRFTHDWVAVHVSPLTMERYGFALAHVRRHLGQRPLQKLQPADLATFYAALHRDGLAPRTIKLIHRITHKALGQAKLWALVRDNAAELAKPPRAQDQEVKMLQPAEAAALVERLRGGPLYMIALLALGTGCRRNELLALRWCDIDLGAGRITISQSLEQTTTAFEPRGRRPVAAGGIYRYQLPLWTSYGVIGQANKSSGYGWALGRRQTAAQCSRRPTVHTRAQARSVKPGAALCQTISCTVCAILTPAC